VESRLLNAYTSSLRRSKYALSWLYFDVLDECGHERGGKSEAYPALIRRVDSWVRQVLGALNAAGIADTTTILIMSDHGRSEPERREHGGFSTDELAVQWLLVGPGIKPGHQITWPVSIMDGAPTLLHALGISPPVEFYGRVVLEAFEGADPGWHAPNASAVELTLPVQPGASGGALGWMAGWDGASLLMGGLAGVVFSMGVACAAAAMGIWPRGRSQAATRTQAFPYLASHPAANRLRAAAGEPDQEMQGLLR